MFFDGNINTMAKLALQDLDLVVLAVGSAATSAVVRACFYIMNWLASSCISILA